MPTPFSHLRYAQDLLATGAMLPEARAAVLEALPAFLLGNIAPDVQTVSGQAREATHFFTVPLGGGAPAEAVLLATYPGLRRLPVSRAHTHAAFVAGYLAHLVYDQAWIRRIFEPAFGPAQRWGTFAERLYLHNALRVHCDTTDLASLDPPVAGQQLGAARPASWLPFVADPYLAEWRDLVAEQLGPGAAARTVEVFAARMRTDPARLAELVASPVAMQERVWARLPGGALAGYEAEALAASTQVINAYWLSERSR